MGINPGFRVKIYIPEKNYPFNSDMPAPQNRRYLF
jgi:hypothetical protein